MDKKELLNKIENMNLTKKEKRVAEFFLEREDSIFLMNVADIAKEIDISETSVIRFIKNIGFKNFTDFKNNGQEKIKNHLDKTNSFIKNIDKNSEFFAFPTPKALADASIDDLNACSLGYRSPYIEASAKSVYRGDIDLEALSKLDDNELLAALMSLKGVGIKVANCVALFGYHRIAAFPIDVWIKRMIDEHYDGEFPLKLYDGYAGVIQQYIFYYGRESTKHAGK